MKPFDQREINIKDTQVLYKLPANWLSSSFETVTKTGALSSASTITAVGPYDKIAVTGGTNTSSIYLSNLFNCVNDIVYKLKLKVDTKGTTACLIGFWLKNAAFTQDTGSNSDHMIYINLTSGLIYVNYGATVIPTALTTKITPSFSASGDILDITYTRNSQTAIHTFIVQNERTGGYAIANTNTAASNQSDINYAIRMPGFILADVTATIIDFTIESMYRRSPLLHMIGDSIGLGYNTPYYSNVEFKLKQSIPFNVINSCSNASYIYGINAGQLREVIETNPRAVVCFFWLSLYYAEYEVGNANNTVYMAQWNNIMAAINILGIKIILFKVNAWALSNGGNAAADATAWNSFIVAQQLIYTNIIIADATGISQSYDSSGYHFDATTSEAFKKVIVLSLAANALI